ncbi:MAG: hypothetical protein U9R74_08970 [Pseudomonadota bacterium]|nr:hypothetical protein [Pseudomonadota bacterium]
MKGILALMALMAAGTGHAWEYRSMSDYSAGYGDTRITSQTFGEQTFSNGTVDGKPYRATSQEFGEQTFTNGRIGDRSFNCTTQTFGGQTYTNCY